ncbi:MAG: CAP domain-containing protein [Saprospiraceae bacterium]
MNKQLFKTLPLLAFLFLLACNAPKVAQESDGPLKTVEQTRRDAHRNATSTETDSNDKDESDDNDNASTETPTSTTETSTNDEEFTEKSVGEMGEKPAYMQADEFAMIAEVNLLRADPKGYIKYVEEYIQQVEKDERFDAAYRAEEVVTAKELIGELKKLDKLSLLQPHEGLYQVGQKHGKDVQQQGMIGHRGSDGTMPWDRVRNNTDLKNGNENLVGGGESVREQVMILLVDSGISMRGHRKTLLDPSWTHVACHKIGKVGQVDNSWIQMFGSE